MAREGLIDDTGYDFGELQAEYEEELKSKFYNEGWEDGYNAAFKDFECMSKADICEEFANRLLDRPMFWPYGEHPDLNYITASNLVGELNALVEEIREERI